MQEQQSLRDFAPECAVPARCVAMPIRNADVAAAFVEIADLLTAAGANPFRIRAYRKAARVLDECRVELPELIARGEPLPRMPGIGKELSAKIAELARTGCCCLLARLRRDARPLEALLEIRGVGPKRARTLIDELGIQSPAQLLAAAQHGQLRDLPGFGERLERRLLGSVARGAQASRRFMRAEVAPLVAKLLRYLRGVPGVTRVDVAGSYRRGRETVGDLDIVVTGSRGHMAGFALTVFEDVAATLVQGPHRVSVVLRNGLQVDLCIVNPAAYAAALLYFTGSRDHAIALRARAQQRGLKLNEYGLFAGRKRVAGTSEAEIYRALGLPFIDPELREDRGEIAAAQSGRLPRLLRRVDLHGLLHVCGPAGQGRDAIHALACAARDCGLRYVVVCCSTAESGTRTFDAAAWQRYRDEMDAVATNGAVDIELLRGIDVPILRDGRVDVPKEVLRESDIVIGGLRDGFEITPEQQIRRLLAAIEQRAIDVLTLRDARSFDTEERIVAALRTLAPRLLAAHVALELDVCPDLPETGDRFCRVARELGIPFFITSRAAGAGLLHELDRTIVQARRGWLEAPNVLNHLLPPALRRWRRQSRRAAAVTATGTGTGAPA